MDTGQLADALHQIRHRGREEPGDVLVGGGSILDGVVEQSRLDGLGVQMQLLRHDLGHRQRVGDEGRAVLPHLRSVGLGSELEGGPDLLEVGAGVIAADGVLQLAVALLQISQTSGGISGTRDAGAVVFWVSVMVIASPFGLHDLMQAL